MHAAGNLALDPKEVFHIAKEIRLSVTMDQLAHRKRVVQQCMVGVVHRLLASSQAKEIWRHQLARVQDARAGQEITVQGPGVAGIA